MTLWANFFARGVEQYQELCVKKILRKFLRKFFLEPFKVKIFLVIVIYIFFNPNIIRFWCLVAQMKAKIELYETVETEKKIA